MRRSTTSTGGWARRLRRGGVPVRVLLVLLQIAVGLLAAGEADCPAHRGGGAHAVHGAHGAHGVPAGPANGGSGGGQAVGPHADAGHAPEEAPGCRCVGCCNLAPAAAPLAAGPELSVPAIHAVPPFRRPAVPPSRARPARLLPFSTAPPLPLHA